MMRNQRILIKAIAAKTSDSLVFFVKKYKGR